MSTEGVNVPVHCFVTGLVIALTCASLCRRITVEIFMSSRNRFCPYPFFDTKATCTELLPDGRKGLMSTFSRSQSAAPGIQLPANVPGEVDKLSPPFFQVMMGKVLVPQLVDT